MNEKHLNVLKEIRYHPQKEVGRNVLRFGNQVQRIEDLNPEMNRRFNRNDLFEFCSDKTNSDLVVTVSIMAWGGMRVDHGKRLFENWNHIKEIVKNIRSRNISTRKEVFHILQNERKNGNLKGMGISFFTKLICFLNKDLNGYIMDQWTAKSINLIWGVDIIDINGSGWITDQNTPDIYENFCCKIEEVANFCNVAPLIAEEMIFSVGGRKKGPWRVYVINNYKN